MNLLYVVKYKDLPDSILPKTESLKLTFYRVIPFWKGKIEPLLKEDKNLLISAHGNSLRALVKYLDHISDREIVVLNIPTGIPLIYEFDDKLKPVKHYYLGDQGKIVSEINKVKNQGKKK